MAKFSDHITRVSLWIQTLAAPLVLGLFFGGITYLIFPDDFGFKLGIGIAFSGLTAGIIITVIRIVKNKGPASFYPHQKKGS